MMASRDDLRRLRDELAGLAPVAIAVSGGVDSMTLAFAAAETLAGQATAYHAVSPAVPPEATARVQHYAEQYGWQLQIIDAGEFSDPRYLQNPVNRCFFCKTNLYAAIRSKTEVQIVSGTNLDDLDDFRPGLQAASEHGVAHPYVEAGIDKTGVRRLAGQFGLDDLAELPAAPCLSSRLQTGITVKPEHLSFVHAVENLFRQRLNPETVRCRIRRDGFVVELDTASLRRLEDGEGEQLQRELATLSTAHGYIEAAQFQPYRRGSAFLKPEAHGD